jgi:hypothetical protein
MIPYKPGMGMMEARSVFQNRNLRSSSYDIQT